MKGGFLPDRRNLGGKQDIDTLQKKHLLALINARSVTTNFEKPHPHVNCNLPPGYKKGMAFDAEFREVQEAKRRVRELKKGGVDNSLPKTYYRKYFIKNRTCKEKNIEEQDHKRNIISIQKKREDMDLKSLKNKDKIIALSQRQASLSNLFLSKHDHSLFSSTSQLQFKLQQEQIRLGSRPSTANKKQVQDRSSIDYIEGNSQQQDFQNKYSLLYPQQTKFNRFNMQKKKISPQSEHQHLVSMDSSQAITSQRNASHFVSPNAKKNYLDNENEWQQYENLEYQEPKNNNYMESTKDENSHQQDFQIIGESGIMLPYEGGDKQRQYYGYGEEQQIEEADYYQQNNQKPQLKQQKQQQYQQYQQYYQQQEEEEQQYQENEDQERYEQEQEQVQEDDAQDYEQDEEQQEAFKEDVPFYMKNEQPKKQEPYSLATLFQDLPQIPKSNSNPYSDLKKNLMKIIINHNLFEKNTIMELANLTKKKNPHLDLNQLSKICKNILLRLYGNSD